MNRNQFLYSKTFTPGVYIVRVIIAYLTEMFNTNAELGFKPYNDQLNKEDSVDSVLITSKNDWEEKYRNKRPSIIISRGNISNGAYGTLPQGNFLSNPDNGDTVNYSDLISCPIVVESICESDTDSELLSSIVASFLTLIPKTIHSFGLQLQGSTIITPPVRFEKTPISFISSVNFVTQLNRQYRAKLINNNQLEHIKLYINANNINI